MTPPLAQLTLGDLDHELKTTRRVFERLPDEHFDWQPHEKSMALGALAAHIVNLVAWMRWMVEDDHYDLAATPPPRDVPTNRQEMLDEFDDNAEKAKAALAGLDEGRFFDSWALRKGDHVIFEQPRVAVLRGMGLNHILHHRAQLTVYYRLLGIPVPSVYGPSADENNFG